MNTPYRDAPAFLICSLCGAQLAPCTKCGLDWTGARIRCPVYEPAIEFHICAMHGDQRSEMK